MTKKIRQLMIILWVSAGLLQASGAGPAELRGRVSDAETSQPIQGVIVKGKGSFAKSDREGRFELKLKEGADSILFRSLGYEALALPITADFSDVRLKPKTTRLNDVIVEAPDIYSRGDTLVFNVSRYARANDNAIIDVIKRLPGIKVKDDGTIEYQGKPINKFYIDGNDFIGGQYGLATNNISHKDVKSVEVMENHQPVKALEGIEFPEEAGINLKLKEDARSRWVGLAKAGIGLQPTLYTGSAFTMRMAPKIQNMMTLKADNTGWNPASEITDHDFGDMFSSDYSASPWPEYISADVVSSPLSEKRSRDNLSWLADAITAWKRGDTSMRLRLDYMGDRLDYHSGLTTDYFSDQIPDFLQSEAIRSQDHEACAQLYTQTNKRGYYLKDKLTLSGALKRSSASITGSFDLSQRVSRRSLGAENDLKWVKRNEKRVITLTSRNSLSYRPDRLTVAGEENATQRIGSTDVRSTTEMKAGKLTRFWKYYITGGLDLNYHRLNGRLDGMGIYDNEEVHEAFLSTLYATPQVDFERSGWRLSWSVPLKWLHYDVNGHHDYINVNPIMSARLQLTAKSDISGSMFYGLSSPQAYLNIDVPILSDYRNLLIASGSERQSQSYGATLSYRYRNPVKAIFLNLSASYSHQRSGVMLNQIFTDDLIISTYTDKFADNDFVQLKGGFSKGLCRSRIVVGLEAQASVTSASSMRDNLVIPYRQAGAGMKSYFKGSLLKWLSANYEADYSFTKLRVDGEENDFQTLRQNLFVTILPNDFVNLSLGGEHFLTRFPEGNSANLMLLDASAAWRVNGKVRLSLTGNNLLNKRRYEYVTYSTLSRSEHSFRLRPRSIVASIQYRF